MNIEELTSSLKKEKADLYSNLSVEFYTSEDTNENSKSDLKQKPFFNSSMAEASQFLVFEEILNNNNSISFTELEDNVYDRYDTILKQNNKDFIFSLKMPFYDWIKLQMELGNINVNMKNGDPMLSISKPIEDLLQSKLDVLYSITGENKKRAVS